MDFVLLITASVCFSLGGLLMKVSAGASRVWPTAGFLLLFLTGAMLQALAMKRSDLAVAYIFVLGAEAAITFLLSVVVLKETTSLPRVAAVFLVVAGIVLLRRT